MAAAGHSQQSASVARFDGPFQGYRCHATARSFDASQAAIAENLYAEGSDAAASDDESIEDDRLRLIFTCCHPALPPEARVALTLREVCGLTTEKIAWAFLTAPPTLAQRIVRAEPSPVVELNRAVAVAMRDRPEAGLALIDAILARGDLAEYHLAHGARADLCRRLGRTAEARAFYERALGLTRQEPERRFLERRLSELG